MSYLNLIAGSPTFRLCLLLAACIRVYACLDTCCSHFLTIVAGVDLHFRHESELPVCRTRVAVVQGEAANHYTNDAGIALVVQLIWKGN